MFLVILYLAACFGVGKYYEGHGSGFWSGIIYSLCLTPILAFLMEAAAHSDSKR